MRPQVAWHGDTPEVPALGAPSPPQLMTRSLSFPLLTSDVTPCPGWALKAMADTIFGSGNDQWVCPNDRQLALRAK